MAVEYISREAAYRFMFDIPNPGGAGEIEVVSVDDLETIPFAVVVARDCYDRLLAENDELRKERPVRHGRWLKYSPYSSDMMTCSECEKYWILDGDQYDYHYCPNCGALMDKDGDK